jgi:hypothetical protein
LVRQGFFAAAKMEAAMAENRGIAQGMQVLTSDGELLGTVDAPASDGFMLRRMGPSNPTQEAIPDMWILRVDEQVHLNRTGAEALAGWKSRSFETSSGERPGAPDDARVEKEGRRSSSWLIWVLVALVALAVAALLYVQFSN